MNNLRSTLLDIDASHIGAYSSKLVNPAAKTLDEYSSILIDTAVSTLKLDSSILYRLLTSTFAQRKIGFSNFAWYRSRDSQPFSLRQQ